MEILAPAGNLEIFKVAIQAGCDAVYISGKNFGARKSAPNFTYEELKEAVIYAHLRKRLVYITINTIIYDYEFEELHKYLIFLSEIDVDAVIVQDYGVLFYIRTYFPNITVHASTQMNIHNEEGAVKLKAIGVKRVILARETPLDEIKKIIKTGIEVEVFGHGALCYSYSGQCLMSYMIGKRSGNRGECAQPCRKKYQLYENNKLIGNYCSLMSMKDLKTIDYLDELVKSGVTSLKIEGRMKSLVYVYTVISSYVNYLNKKTSYDYDDDLKIAFNREFTKGYMFSEKNSDITNIKSVNHQGLEIGKIKEVNNNKIGILTSKSLNLRDGIRIVGKTEIGFFINNLNYENGLYYIPGKYKVNVGDKVYKTVDGVILDKSEELLNLENYHYNLNITFSSKLNEPLCLEIESENVKVSVKSKIINEIAKKPIDETRIKEQLLKTNNKLLNISKVTILYDNTCFFKISELNELRRIGLEKWLNEYLRKRSKTESSLLSLPKINTSYNHNISFDFVVQNIEQYNWCRENGFLNIYKVYDDTFRRHFHLNKLTNKGMIHNFCDLGLNQVVSPSFNITNQYALKFIDSYGVDTMYLSNELSTDEKIKLAKVQTNANKGVFIYGHMEVMCSKHCFINKLKKKTSINCGLCKHNKYSIMDEYNNQMFVSGRCNNDGPEILIYSYKLYDDLKNIDYYIENGFSHFLIMLTNETIDDLNNLMKKIKRIN